LVRYATRCPAYYAPCNRTGALLSDLGSNPPSFDERRDPRSKLEYLRPQRDSNPRRRLERAVSWAWLDDGDPWYVVLLVCWSTVGFSGPGLQYSLGLARRWGPLVCRLASVFGNRRLFRTRTSIRPGPG